MQATLVTILNKLPNILCMPMGVLAHTPFRVGYPKKSTPKTYVQTLFYPLDVLNLTGGNSIGCSHQLCNRP